MGNVIPLHQPLDERRLHEALREITDASTTSVVLIATGPGYVGVRSFGPADQVKQAMLETISDQSEAYRLRQALQQIADFGPGLTHEWAEHVRQVARNALKG